MKKLWILVLSLVLGCDQLTKESDQLLPPQETPPSYLSFRVEFPIKELQTGVNRVLPETLFDDAVALKDDKDTLFLKVVRKGELSLNMKGNEVFASIPLDVEAAIKKKVLGITFSNEDSPIAFSGTLRASAQVGLNNNWDMELACQYRSFDLEGMDEFSIMGISFNVQKAVENAIESHTDDLSNVICQAVQSAFNFRDILSNVYSEIQSPLRVAQDPLPLYLYTNPSALNGELLTNKRDTLSLHVEYRSDIQLSPNVKSVKPNALPVRKNPLNTDNRLMLYPDVRISYSDLSSLLSKTLSGKSFEYEGYEINIESADVKPSGQRLQIDLTVSGDVKGKVKVSGVPVLNTDRSMSLSEFKYEIKSDDNLLNMADWLSHQFIEEYLSSQVQIDTKPFFEKLDELIVKGIASTPIKHKLGVRVKFDNIQTYQFRCTEEFIQWIFVVEGSSQLTLKNGLFQ
ncbi:DUF4403 family protein [Marinoscillum pacificum]|uniref:DUF4403 family protein n=1 Tax=Marinoscillum pacificum TaxID=392723 RepID=UPI0021575576|nr:DUF4403 family protein [Marinoscillum pacificum]